MAEGAFIPMAFTPGADQGAAAAAPAAPVPEWQPTSSLPPAAAAAQNPPKLVADATAAYRRFAAWIDTTAPQLEARWAVVAGLVVVYVLRLALVGAFHVVTYCLAMYELNMAILFVSPKYDPDEATEEGGVLPSRTDDEFRPFVRRLPEFLFWWRTARALVLAVLATFVPFLQVPVSWPILLGYFLLLTAATLRTQIAHMFKHGYRPWDQGKVRY